MKIPRIMSTQHPDNALMPRWAKNHKIFSNDLEIDEIYHSFRMGCDEQLWDWEGKDVDTNVIRKLLTKYPNFFKDKVIGQDCFITYRVPNPDVEIHERKLLLEALETIPKNADIASAFYSRETIPIFEVALPMTQNHLQLLRLDSYYKNIVFGKQHMHLHSDIEEIKIKDWVGNIIPEKINIIPLVEDKTSIISISNILKGFITHRKPEYMRPWLARSDTALNYGLISSVLLVKYGASEVYRVEEDTGVKQFPIVGTGSLPFRGHLRPENLKNFLKQYKEFHTFTMQSSAKYDFETKKIRRMISRLKKHKSSTKPFVEEEREDVIDIINICSHEYQHSISLVYELVNEIAVYVPNRRMRKLHIGLFGYSRKVKDGIHLPRAITFTACMYSLSLPPEFLGLRAVEEIERKGIFSSLKKFYPVLEKDLTFASKFFSRDCLRLLRDKGLISKEFEKTFLEDVSAAETYFSIDPGPKSEEDEKHERLSKQLINNFGKKITKIIERQSIIRKSIG